MDKRYLHVPYKERNQVKKLGGRWDSVQKKWWVPMSVPLETLKKWKPENKSLINELEFDAREHLKSIKF
jgi:hypothetical protein